MKLPRFIQDILAMVLYLFFGAIEISIIFGIFLACVLVPWFIANQLGAKTGDNLTIGAIALGIALMVLWYWFLDSGGRKNIEAYFHKLTHKSIHFVGAGDAIYDD